LLAKFGIDFYTSFEPYRPASEFVFLHILDTFDYSAPPPTDHLRCRMDKDKIAKLQAQVRIGESTALGPRFRSRAAATAVEAVISLRASASLVMRTLVLELTMLFIILPYLSAFASLVPHHLTPLLRVQAARALRAVRS